MSLVESLAKLVREWKREGKARPAGPSVLHEERQAGRAEAYRKCAQQLSLVLASFAGRTVEAGLMVAPDGESEAARAPSGPVGGHTPQEDSGVVVPSGYVEALIVLAEGCAEHPAYRGMGEPSTACPVCRMVWAARQRLDRFQGGGDWP